jgi:hypothetical protein
MSRTPAHRQVDLTKTVVEAKLPIPFDRAAWIVELHPGYLAFRRYRTTDMFTLDYESLIGRAIAIAVEERRRAKRRTK